MLVVRESQLHAFSATSLREVAPSLADALREQFPRPCERVHCGIDTFVERGMRAAVEYGMTTQQQVYFYLGLMLLMGVDFDGSLEPRWVTDLLSRSTCSPMANLEEVWQTYGRRPRILCHAGIGETA